jgi:hypothetical protein
LQSFFQQETFLSNFLISQGKYKKGGKSQHLRQENLQVIIAVRKIPPKNEQQQRR